MTRLENRRQRERRLTALTSGLSDGGLRLVTSAVVGRVGVVPLLALPRAAGLEVRARHVFVSLSGRDEPAAALFAVIRELFRVFIDLMRLQRRRLSEARAARRALVGPLARVSPRVADQRVAD